MASGAYGVGTARTQLVPEEHDLVLDPVELEAQVGAEIRDHRAAITSAVRPANTPSSRYHRLSASPGHLVLMAAMSLWMTRLKRRGALLHALLACRHQLREPQQRVLAAGLAVAPVNPLSDLGEVLRHQSQDARARGKVEGVLEVY
jgi:hypothetical protein